MTKQIELTQGKVAIVSDHRFEHLNQWGWKAQKTKAGKWYATRTEGFGVFRKVISMHREITGVTDPKIEVDHRDGDGLNNVDDNLRICTGSENQANRGKQKNNTTGYKGVTLIKSTNKYMVQIGNKGSNIYVGVYSDLLEAAKAYDAAAKELHGDFAVTNF